MGSHVEEVTICRVDWSDKAALILAPSVPYASIEDLRAQVEAGAVLFEVKRGADLVGFYILRVDQAPSGAEGVLVAAAARDEMDLTAFLLPHIETQFIGCRSVRIHTARPGLAKKLATRGGYGAAEIIMRKVLK